jgi:choline dehydrogenase-like flavoprotein
MPGRRKVDEGWSYEDVIPLSKCSEHFSRGESEYYGAGGPLPVAADYEPHPLQRAHGRSGPGARDSVQRRSQRPDKDNVRHSQTVAFLRPVLGAPNLTVLTGTRARRLVLEGGRCVGVDIGGRELRRSRRSFSARARSSRRSC